MLRLYDNNADFSVSKEFNKTLKDAAKDKVINKKELTELKQNVHTERDKDIAERLSSNNSNISFSVEEKTADLKTLKSGKSLTEYSLSVDLEDDVQPTKADIPPLKINNWDGYTKDNIENFKNVFSEKPGSNPPVINEAASLLLTSIFSKKANNVASLQKLVGDVTANGNFGAKSFFLLKEYLATNINKSHNLENCEEIKNQIELIKTYFPNISEDSRFKEMESNLAKRTVFFLNNKVNEAQYLDDFTKIKPKIASLTSLTDTSAIKENFNKKSENMIGKNIDTSIMFFELEELGKNVSELKKDFPETKLPDKLSKKAEELFNKDIDSLKNIYAAPETKSRLEKFKPLLAENTYKDLSDKLGKKASQLTGNFIKETHDKLDFYLSKGHMERGLQEAKKVLPADIYQKFEKEANKKLLMLELYGVPESNGKYSGLNADNVTQGKIGDCYFMAPLAGLVAKHPEKIMKMITPSDDGKFYTVKFPGAKKAITIPKPTNDEVEKYARKGDAFCIWVPVIEKAFAYYDNQHSAISKKNPYDMIDNDKGVFSNSTNYAIELLTGSSTDSDIFTFTSKNTTREKLAKALGKGNIVAASTVNSGNKPKNLMADHSYTILSFDAKADTVRIRNPHGGGSDGTGFKNGDDGKNDGTFTLTIDELNKYFSSITYQE